MNQERVADQMPATAPIDSADIRTLRAPFGDFPLAAQQSVLDRIRADIIAENKTPEDLFDSRAASRVPAHEVDSFKALALAIYQGLLHEDDVTRLIELLYVSDNTPLLAKYRIVHPSYRIYDDHYANAALPSGSIPSVRPKAPHRGWRFLNQQLGFPIGVAASGLTTNALCVQRLFHAGYNVLTYKTVRSRGFSPHARPNWTIANGLSFQSISDPGRPVTVSDTSIHVALNNGSVSTANSFGVPSADPREWVDDVASAVRAAAEDQLLICSVLGEDYSATPTEAGLLADFVAVAEMAVTAGVRAVELNLSCPNTLAPDGGVREPLCVDVRLTAQIVQSVRAALPESVQLGVKLAWMEPEILHALLDECAPHLDFITGINTVQRIIQNAEGAEFFKDRSAAGIGGYAIADYAVQFVTEADEYRRLHGLNFAIIGVGGVTDAASFERLYNAGADVVQSVSGVFLNSLLADDCVRELRLTLPLAPEQIVKDRIVALTETATPSWVYTTELPQPAGMTFGFIDELIASGKMQEVTSGSLRHFARVTKPRSKRVS